MKFISLASAGYATSAFAGCGRLFKQGEHAIDKDQVYADLARHFSDEEIIELGLFCAEVDGVGKFVKSLNVLSWEEACELNPKLTATAAQVAAESLDKRRGNVT